MKQKTDYSKVNWMTVREVSVLWEKELNIAASTIERELRIALYKLEQDYPIDEPISVNPDTVDLPSPDTLINRDFIERFYGKQLWKLPDFWFKELSTGPSFPGRPSVMRAIVQELEARAQNNTLADTLAEQARQMSGWAKQEFPGKQTPTPQSTENGIRMVYKGFKKGAE